MQIDCEVGEVYFSSLPCGACFRVGTYVYMKTNLPKDVVGSCIDLKSGVACKLTYNGSDAKVTPFNNAVLKLN